MGAQVMSETLLVDRSEGVLAITFNCPERKNALTAEMYQAFAHAVNTANDDRDVRVILIRGAGDSFTAGHDLSEFAAISRGEADVLSPSGLPMLQALANARKPLVAAVHGRAVGIGLTMLLHCDLVYVAEDALLSVPFVNLALVPEAAASLLLPARIGHVRAFELFTLGQPIDGRTAQAWGIANAAVPAGEVHARALAAARALASRPPAAAGLTKALMREGPAVHARIEEELAHFYAQLRSPEAREAFSAFFEKRPADFSRF
jgi:enoyl-CoA hydratase/carnithine racemase